MAFAIWNLSWVFTSIMAFAIWNLSWVFTSIQALLTALQPCFQTAFKLMVLLRRAVVETSLCAPWSWHSRDSFWVQIRSRHWFNDWKTTQKICKIWKQQNKVDYPISVFIQRLISFGGGVIREQNHLWLAFASSLWFLNLIICFLPTTMCYWTLTSSRSSFLKHFNWPDAILTRVKLRDCSWPFAINEICFISAQLTLTKEKCSLLQSILAKPDSRRCHEGCPKGFASLMKDISATIVSISLCQCWTTQPTNCSITSRC